MEREQNKVYYGQIYYVIPQEEESYKEIFRQGKTWHNNLWQKKSKYREILHHYQGLIKEQKNENKKIQDSRKKITEIINDIRKWFKDEYEFLKIQDNSDKRPYNRSDLWPLLKETKYEKFGDFYKKWSELIDEGSDDEPPILFLPDEENSLDNLRGYLARWHQLSKGKDLIDIVNPYEMYLVKQTKSQITFNWSPPDNIFAHFEKYLFNYQGIWYEYDNLERKDWNKAEFTVNYSIYWNDYWYLLNANANGYLHNSPYLQTEICACPDFTQSEETVKNTFVVTNYELKFHLLRAYGHTRKTKNWYLLWLNGKEGKVLQSSNSDFPWIKLGSWKKVEWKHSGDWKWFFDIFFETEAEAAASDVAKGYNEQLFSLVSQRQGEPTSTSIAHFAELQAWTDVEVTNQGEVMELKKGEKAKEFKDWIDTEYSLDLSHCKTNHIECSILWRDNVVWRGNLNEIEGLGSKRLYLKLIETSNPAGTTISFHDKYGNFLGQVKESIFIKIGKADENNVILNTIITTAMAAAIGAATGGVGASFGAEATAATVGAAAKKGAITAAVAGRNGSFIGRSKG
jgi:hypothetical protein